ncbi:MAG TPA: hypothetical protein VH417_07955 [Vicinamibacterales bacterium]|jgi:hypothetical protein
MEQGRGRFLRENAFLTAAVCLPLIVVVFFVLASVIPRWLVPPPAYDLLIRANDVYTQSNSRVSVDFAVRDGSVEVIVKPLPAGLYNARSRLFLFEHATMNVSEVSVEMPEHAEDLTEHDPPLTRRVAALAGRRVVDQLRAPDGYQLENRGSRGAGIVGELFGMSRYGAETALVNKGRVIPIRLPLAVQEIYYAPVSFVGWVEPPPSGGPR